MKSRFSEEQIIGILKQQESGRRVAEICREQNISPKTFSAWKGKYGGLKVNKAQRLRQNACANSKARTPNYAVWWRI